jgi:putative glutamine amidotransferase
MKPRIGITTFIDKKPRSDYVAVSSWYARSVASAGGLALALPIERPEAAESYVEGLDGLLLSGGKDIDPVYYGEEPAKGIGGIDAGRHAWELALFKAASDRGLPILGICKGIQLINVALGGNLFQDLAQRPGTRLHNPEAVPVDQVFHGLKIVEGSLLARALGGTETRVNSFHHQALKDLGRGLRISATAPDGVIEAVESTEPGAFILGLQFHPESLFVNYPAFLGIFSAFTKACLDRGRLI